LVVAKVRERLAVSKRAAQKIDMERFIVKKLNEGAVKEQYQVTIRNMFAPLETYRTVGTSTGHGIILERTSKFRPKSVWVIVNQSTVNRGLMRDVQNWLIEGSRLNYIGCRTQVQRMKGI
jgi:hypothetical protein